jgi:hypothetical protein
MRELLTGIMGIAASVTHALASGGSEAGGMGLWGNLFIAFGVMIVVFQLIPGIMLLVGMVKGVFSLREKKADESAVAGGPESS